MSGCMSYIPLMFQNELSFPNYFFNSTLTEHSPYFLLPPQLLRFNDDKRGVLKMRKGGSVCETSYFGIPVESQTNKVLTSSLLSSDVEQLMFDHTKLPSVLHTFTTTPALPLIYNICFNFSANHYEAPIHHRRQQTIRRSSDVVDGTILVNRWTT